MSYKKDLKNMLRQDGLFEEDQNQQCFFKLIDKINDLADKSLGHLYLVLDELLEEGVDNSSTRALVGYLSFSTLRMRCMPVFIFNDESKALLEAHVRDVAGLFKGEEFRIVGKLILKPQKIHRFEVFTWMVLYMYGDTRVPEINKSRAMVGLGAAIDRFHTAIRAYKSIRVRPADRDKDLIALSKEEYEGIYDFYTFASCTLSPDPNPASYGSGCCEDFCEVMTFVADGRRYRLGYLCKR